MIRSEDRVRARGRAAARRRAARASRAARPAGRDRDGAGARAELLCVSREAARAGVRAGMSAAHARSLCAGLALRVASPALEQTARDALLDAAFSCAPRAALAPRSGGVFAGEAAVFVDAAGTGALFRSEAGFATALAARIRRRSACPPTSRSPRRAAWR